MAEMAELLPVLGMVCAGDKRNLIPLKTVVPSHPGHTAPSSAASIYGVRQCYHICIPSPHLKFGPSSRPLALQPPCLARRTVTLREGALRARPLPLPTRCERISACRGSDSQSYLNRRAISGHRPRDGERLQPPREGLSPSGTPRFAPQVRQAAGRRAFEALLERAASPNRLSCQSQTSLYPHEHAYG